MAYNKGYQYFSVGETRICSGYAIQALLPSNRVNDGCQGKTADEKQCDDGNGLVACIGADDRDYIYELVSPEGEIELSACLVSQSLDPFLD